MLFNVILHLKWTPWIMYGIVYIIYSDDVAASGQAMSSVVNDSVSFTESELTRHRHGQHNHGDSIPEDGGDMGGGEVIRNPNTSSVDDNNHETEEATTL